MTPGQVPTSGSARGRYWCCEAACLEVDSSIRFYEAICGHWPAWLFSFVLRPLCRNHSPARQTPIADQMACAFDATAMMLFTCCVAGARFRTQCGRVTVRAHHRRIRVRCDVAAETISGGSCQATQSNAATPAQGTRSVTSSIEQDIERDVRITITTTRQYHAPSGAQTLGQAASSTYGNRRCRHSSEL